MTTDRNKLEDTLDPPGTIAIIGGGPLGIEAALYGRYLGYDVTLFEAGQLVQGLRAAADHIAPQPCTTPLGIAAIAAQRGLGGTSVDLQIATIADWIGEYYDRLLDCDLLADRLHTWTEVTHWEDAPLQADDPIAADEESAEAQEVEEDDATEEDEEGIPPDFLVHFRTLDGQTHSRQFEALIDARGATSVPLAPAGYPNLEDRAYLFVLGRKSDPEMDFASGLGQVRQIFAQLWGRASLDVYSNLGG